MTKEPVNNKNATTVKITKMPLAAKIKIKKPLKHVFNKKTSPNFSTNFT